VTYDVDFTPIPVPQYNVQFANLSIPPGYHADFNFSINYQAGVEGCILDRIGGVERFTVSPPEARLDSVGTSYVYFGFFTNDSGKVYPAHTLLTGSYNYTVYELEIGAHHPLIAVGVTNTSEYFGISAYVNSPFIESYNYAGIPTNGTFVAELTNTGQSILNVTCVIGYSRVSIARPYMIAGFVTLAASGAFALAAFMIFLHYKRRLGSPRETLSS
jgi:hypothetical protein